jgi:hypothetical protein
LGRVNDAVSRAWALGLAHALAEPGIYFTVEMDFDRFSDPLRCFDLLAHVVHSGKNAPRTPPKTPFLTANAKAA